MGALNTGFPRLNPLEALQNLAAGIGNTAFLYATLGQVTYDRFMFSDLGNGSTSIYTVPAGMRAIIRGSFYNTSGGSINVNYQVQINGSGTVFPIAAVTAVGSGVENDIIAQHIFEGGDVISVLTNGAGLNAFGQVILFPNTSSVKTKRFTSFASGNNTIYTATQNTVLMTNALFNLNSSPNAEYVNESGSTATVAMYVVPSGSSPGTGNQCQGGSVTNGTLMAFGTDYHLQAGDSIVVNTNQTGPQLAWVTVIEGA